MNDVADSITRESSGVEVDVLSGHVARMGDNSSLSTNRYFAFDIRNPFVAEKKAELARLYQTVFNEIKDVPTMWTPKGAEDMIDARLRTTGCNLVLVDVAENNKIVGAFLSIFIPGPKGWILGEPDVLVDERYRGQGLGSELGWLGRKQANEICSQLYGENIVEDDSKTYVVPEFPQNMWVRKGYVLYPLFAQSARELVGRDTALKGVRLYEIDESNKAEEMNRLVNFIANKRGHTRSSDGFQWDSKRADAFVRFMLENNFATFNIAVAEEKIVAINAASIMPGRDGSELVGPQSFIMSSKGLKANGISELTEGEIAFFAFDKLVNAGNVVAKDRWSRPLSSVEISDGTFPFFSEFLPGLEKDKVFQGMAGSHDELIKNLEPSPGKKQIGLVPYFYGPQYYLQRALG